MTVIHPQLQRAPFTVQQAREAEISARVLEGRAVRRVLRGVYVPSTVPTSLSVRVAAARRIAPPDALVTGVTALQLWGLDLGPRSPVQLVTGTQRRTVRSGVHIRRANTLPPGDQGVACPPAVFTAAARDLDLVDLTAAGDWLVRRGRTSREQLIDAAAAARGPGSVLSRRAADLVCEPVDSVRETRLRLLLVLCGLPVPTCNVRLGSALRFIGRVDLAYELYRTILEYEGDQHRSDKWQWDSDITRYEEFTADGYCVIRVTSARLRQPRQLANRTYEAIRANGYPGPPPTFSAEWQSLFE